MITPGQTSSAQEADTTDANGDNQIALVVAIIAAFAGVAGSTVTAIFGLRSAATTQKLTNQAQIDHDMRTRRIEAYDKLLDKMTPLAFYASSDPLERYDKAYEISVKFTDWYYKEKGGLLMSQKSQQEYRKLQDQIKPIVDKYITNKKLADFDQEDQKSIKEIKTAASSLRTSLLEDVGIRPTAQS
jgi:hypothetical protein